MNRKKVNFEKKIKIIETTTKREKRGKTSS